MQIGFHTSAFASAAWDFERWLAWAKRNDVRFVECSAIDGVTWNHGLGYVPHVALWGDPLLLRRTMDRYSVPLSQLDAAFPLSRPEGMTLGVEYVRHTSRWAKLVGCPRVDTTDDRRPPVGLSERLALAHLRWCYRQIAVVIYLAGLQNVPKELYEAAEIDWATSWNKVWHVTLPMISPVILFNVVISLIGAFQYFTQIYAMTLGGPANSTLMLSYYIYVSAFHYFTMGHASAMAWVLFLIIVLFTGVVFKFSGRFLYYGGQ